MQVALACQRWWPVLIDKGGTNANGDTPRAAGGPINGTDAPLYVEVHGNGAPLLLLHGFTGSAADWHPHLPGLAPHYRAVAVDLMGHGRSVVPADGSRHTMDRCVADLLCLLDQLNITRTAVLGYSMGGRVALNLAIAAPERVAALIAISTSPGIANATARAQRRAADAALAQDLQRLGITTFVDRWQRLPLFASQRRLPQAIWQRQRHRRLQNNPRGLAASLRGMGTGNMEPLYGRLPALPMPTLVMAGELDHKYMALARAMVAAIPQAELAVVADAGHNVQLEKPAVFDAVVLDFLQRRYPADGHG